MYLRFFPTEIIYIFRLEISLNLKSSLSENSKLVLFMDIRLSNMSF